MSRHSDAPLTAASVFNVSALGVVTKQAEKYFKLKKKDEMPALT
jgi:hypothetical protein